MNEKELKDLAGIVARLNEINNQLWDFWNTEHQKHRSSKESVKNE